jgi:hypothetical protein
LICLQTNKKDRVHCNLLVEKQISGVMANQILNTIKLIQTFLYLLDIRATCQRDGMGVAFYRG